MDITAELQAVITKSLPEATANEMKRFIEEANATSINLEKANYKIEELNSHVQKMEKEINRLKTFEQKDVDLQMKEKALAAKSLELEEKERNQKMAILETKLDMVNKGQEQIVRLVEKVFGHPSVTVSTSRQVQQRVDEYGNPRYLPTEYLNDSTVTTQSKD